MTILACLFTLSPQCGLRKGLLYHARPYASGSLPLKKHDSHDDEAVSVFLSDARCIHAPTSVPRMQVIVPTIKARK
jgi:hypothetical protein